MTLLTSVLLALLGLLSVLVLLLILSKRIARPVAENYEKQKQFVTDAGHELKTPMTIISANADLTEMECGENQWISDIRRQTQRLTALTNPATARPAASTAWGRPLPGALYWHIRGKFVQKAAMAGY